MNDPIMNDRISFFKSSPNFNAKGIKDTLKDILVKRNNIIVLVAMFTLITGSIFSISLQNSGSDEPTYIITNNSLNETFTGTYNETRSNNILVDSQGFRLNFINGTNNPVKLIDTIQGVNITISDTTGGSGGLTGSGANCNVAFWTNSTNLSGENDLCWDFTNNRLGILTSSRHSSLQVNGSIATITKTVSSSPYTLTEQDFSIICDATSGDRTLNLPTAVGIKGRIYVITQLLSGLNQCTINASGSETFDGSTSPLIFRLFSKGNVIIQSDGSNWIVLSVKQFRYEPAGQWDKVSTKTNIGTAFVDIYDNSGFPNSAGNPIIIETFKKTGVRLLVQWNKIGTGTQTVQLVRCTSSACSAVDTVLVSMAVVSGNNDSAPVAVPLSLLNTFNYYKLQAKSTTGTDDPVFQGAQILII